MPVLINRDTGAAEDLGHDIAANAAQSTHDVPLNDPEGNPVIAPYNEAAGLLKQGYTQPKPEQLQGLLDYSKSDQSGELAKTVGEGAASAYTFGASTAAERAIANPEDINRRREMNPVAHGIGEALGLGAGMLTGTGEAALLERAGQAIAKPLLEKVGATAAGRIGTTAAKLAAENMMFQGGDEASKLFASDPNQSMETAIANIGLSGAIGFGTGGALKGTNELWNMGPGKQLGNLLTTLSNKSAGLPSELKLASGVELAPEMEAALSDNPAARQAFQTLQESTTKAGSKIQESFGKLQTDMQNATATALGKSPEDIQALGQMSKAETGKAFQDSLAKSIQDKIGPIAEQYEKANEMFANAAIPASERINMQNSIANMITEQGLAKGPNEQGLKLAQKAIDQLKLQESAKDLKSYIQGLYQSAPYGSETYQIGKSLRNIFSQGLEDTVTSAASQKGTMALQGYNAVKESYGKFKDVLEELNDRLHLGRESKGGASSFINALKEADPETVAARMSLKGDTKLQGLLDAQFPEAGALAKASEINKLVKASLDKTNEVIDPKKLFRNVAKLEPEMRAHIFTPEATQQLQALEELAKRIPEKMNPSGTAKTLDALWKRVPESAAAVAAMLTGHNPVAGYLIGKAANYVGREAPDAIRLAMLKYLGGSGAINAEGFRATAMAANAAIKGEKMLSSAVQGVFESGAKVIKFPDAAKLQKLAVQVEKVAQNPNDLLDNDNSMGHYIPDHATAVGAINGRAISYLSSLKPSEGKAGPLDAPRKPNAVEEANYKQALLIAEQPLSVIKSIKEGSLTEQEITHLHNLYPALYQRMQEKLVNDMTKAVGDGKTIPYKTKLSLSMFMGMPLESSMQPNAIMASQPVPQQAPQPQSAPARTRSNPNLNKLSKSYATPEQAAEAAKVNQRH